MTTVTATAPHPRRGAARALLGLAAVSAVLGASGCGAVSAVSSSLTGVESRHDDARSDAPERGDLAVVLPDAVAQDATDVSVTVRTEEPGVTTWAWTSSQEPPGSCTPASGSPSPPVDSPDGFPGDLDAGAGSSGTSG